MLVVLRRIAFVLWVVSLAVFALPNQARAEIGSYLVFDMADGSIIAQHRPNALWYPASLTKLMTAYVTFDAVRSGALKMSSPVKISPQAHHQPPSRMGFAIGTVLTVETALRIILTKSANDVTLALAEAVGGTQAGFLRRMNAAAQEIGMVDTFFDNPHGLPNTKQLTTARDVALLMMALADGFAEYSDFLTMPGVTLGSRRLVNHNVLIKRFPGADGMKTGFICSSGFNLAASATRDGRRIGAVVLGGLTSRERNERTAELLEKAFEAVQNGGRVRLDGFGDPEARSEAIPVSGTREDMGTVSELSSTRDTKVNDIRLSVCGHRRPVTRYSDGTAPSREAFQRQRAEYEAWRKTKTERAAQRRAALQAPLAFVDPGAQGAGGPPPGPDSAEPGTQRPLPERRLADAALRPSDWSVPDGSPLIRGVPPRRPDRAPPAPLDLARQFASDLSPTGWVSGNPFWLPWHHPLGGAPHLREPLGERPLMQPISYLRPARSLQYVALRLGGADPSRPEPLSGPVVGGGPAPMPRAKPVLAVVEPVDPTALLEHSQDVRALAADGG